ncbi:hypothetical protein MAUB1S_10580 [Mycolicibacterium aubagnense]
MIGLLFLVAKTIPGGFTVSEQQVLKIVEKQYFRDRYSIDGALLGTENALDLRLLDALKSLGKVGSRFYLASLIPDQYEDFYTILIDDREVVSFELSHRDPAVPEEVQIVSAAEYRHNLGQGKKRIRFDRLLEAEAKFKSNR